MYYVSAHGVDEGIYKCTLLLLLLLERCVGVK